MRRSLFLLCAALSACLGDRGPFANRMAESGTAYLMRAARQPVRWQPWGRDAFTLAAKLDRPILLYIGGDACHWCAETDRASYADPEIGSLINALFVPVRVDRDERPDVAQRYQVAVEHLAGLRGWPLTVFLTADGSAFFGGTYFPADDPVTGRGLKQLLPEVARSYREQRASVLHQATLLRELVLAGDSAAGGALRPELLAQGTALLVRDLDEAVHDRTAPGRAMYAEAISLLLRDPLGRVTALRALDFMLDSTSEMAGEDPPRLVLAALAAGVATAWTVTGEARYRDSGRALVRRLAGDLPTEGVFADQQAYVIDKLLQAATVFEESTDVRRAREALAALLQRAYARGWGARHTILRSTAVATRLVGPLPPPPELLQDQVELALACVAADEPRYLDVALDLVAIIQKDYADSAGGYYDEADGPDRSRSVFDDVLPGANARAALLLARLSRVTGDTAYRQRARRTLEAFAGAARGTGIRATAFLAATRETLATP